MPNGSDVERNTRPVPYLSRATTNFVCAVFLFNPIRCRKNEEIKNTILSLFSRYNRQKTNRVLHSVPLLFTAWCGPSLCYLESFSRMYPSCKILDFFLSDAIIVSYNHTLESFSAIVMLNCQIQYIGSPQIHHTTDFMCHSCCGRGPVTCQIKSKNACGD